MSDRDSITYTFFSKLASNQGERRQGSLEDLARLHEETKASDKKFLPLITLCTFPGDSCKGDTQPESFSGLPLDYDSGDVTVSEMAKAISNLKLHALVYETPGSRPDKIKLRVLLPFSKPLDLAERNRLLDWIGPRLPGTLAEKETRVAKQRWFIGHKDTIEPVDILLSGFPIDLMAKTRKLQAGFDLEARLAEVLASDDGHFALLRDYMMHLARSHEADEVQAIIEEFEEKHFPGYIESLPNDKRAGLRRALNGAIKKAGKVVDMQGKPIEVPPDEPLLDSWELYKASDLAGEKPKPMDFVLPGWLPNEAVTLMAGHGGAGKSYLALLIGLCISQGKPILGVTPKARKVLYMHCEDPRAVVHWRMSHYALGYPDNLLLVDGTTTMNTLFAATQFGLTAPTQQWLDLKALCDREQVEVLVLDGSADFYGANENDRGHVKTFINLLQALCPCVLLLAHVNKLSAQAKSSDEFFSGSTAWHNSVRSRLALMTDEQNNIVLEVQKSNWASTDLCSRVTWNDQKKVFELAEPESKHGNLGELLFVVMDKIIGWESEDEKLYTATSGRHTMWNLFKDDPECPPKLRANQFNRLLQSMLKQDFLAKSSDKKFFVVTEAGRNLTKPTDKF